MVILADPLSTLNNQFFRWGLFYKSLSCKKSVPASEPQRSHRRVTCWADVTLGAVILEKRCGFVDLIMTNIIDTNIIMFFKDHFFVVARSAMHRPWAVLQHLVGSWNKRHAMQVLCSSCRTWIEIGLLRPKDV